MLALVIAAIALGLIDFGLRFPAPLRVGIWLIGAAGLGVMIWRRVLPAWRFRPRPTQVALPLENTHAGRDPRPPGPPAPPRGRGAVGGKEEGSGVVRLSKKKNQKGKYAPNPHPTHITPTQ